MADAPTEGADAPAGSRLMLEPKTIHERDDGVYLDCPQCGSNVSITRIITKGECSGQLEGEVAEAEDDTQLQQDCNATLSLELVWEAD